MLVIYFILCFLQPICLPVPEMMTVLWGSQVLGEVPSFIVGVAGTVLGISVMYHLSGKASAWMIEKFHYKNALTAFRQYVERFQVLIVGYLLIVPVLPDEIIGIGASIVGIPFPVFLLIATASKVVSVGMIAFSEQMGRICAMQQWQIIMIEFGALLLVTRIFKYMDYRKSFNQKEYDVSMVK